MSRVIIFSTGVVRKSLIGPEIRVWEFAKNLSRKGHNATLAVPNSDYPSKMPFEIVQYTSQNLRGLTHKKDVAIVQGDVYNSFIRFAEKIPTVCDLYDPYIVECLHLDPGSFPSAIQTLRTQLLTGDFFLCASEAQRLFYLGMFAVLNRLNPSCFSENGRFDNLISLVPFGASEENLTFKRNSNDRKDKIIFLGGVYSWYDPFISLDCLKIILNKRKDVKFLFIKFPFNIPAIKDMEKKVLNYAAEIGVSDNVAFGEWVPYEERSRLYSGIDIALVLHKATLEADLSFRTRILDFLSFGIPIITNKGGDLETMIKDHECGLLAEENNPNALSDSVLYLIDNQKKRNDLVIRGKALIKERFLWEKVMEPLDAFCRKPSFYDYSGNNKINEYILKKSFEGKKTGFKDVFKKIFKSFR